MAQAAAAVKLEKVEEEEEERAAPAENGQSAKPMAEQSNDASEGPRPEGPPAAVDAAAAELSGEAQQGTQQAQQAAGTKRKQQTKLAVGCSKASLFSDARLSCTTGMVCCAC